MSTYTGKLIAEIHNVPSGSQFAGTAPTASPSDSKGVREYPAATAGGLLSLLINTAQGSLSDNNRTRQIHALYLKGDATTDWTVSITDGTTDILWFIADNAASVMKTDSIHLLPNQQLKITTANAAADLKAIAVYDISPASIVA